MTIAPNYSAAANPATRPGSEAMNRGRRFADQNR